MNFHNRPRRCIALLFSLQISTCAPTFAANPDIFDLKITEFRIDKRNAEARALKDLSEAFSLTDKANPAYLSRDWYQLDKPVFASLLVKDCYTREQQRIIVVAFNPRRGADHHFIYMAY